ncbi:PIN domain-containing protein [Actinoplanes sp. NPDC023936]|uniref:PIN domain-containing protein n=1 Tax=Actinoplanes sp. NPDC023936 TaxID=3154910 RepID=UPI0034054DF5
MVAFPAFLDTCVLYPAYLCDTLLRLAEASAYRPLWSADVFAELRRNLGDRGLPPDRVDRRLGQMARSFPDAQVTGYESLIDGMTNHPKDRHVLAAAVAIHPDDFLLDQLDLYPGVTMDVLRRQAASYRRVPNTVPEILVLLDRTGVPGFAAEVRRHLGPPTW